jgi:hypothetical protein
MGLNLDALKRARDMLRQHEAPKPIELVLMHPDDFDDMAQIVNDSEHMALVPTRIHVQVEELVSIGNDDYWAPIMYTMVDNGENYLLVIMAESWLSSETKIRLYEECEPGKQMILYKQDFTIGFKRPEIVFEPAPISSYHWRTRLGY